MSIKQSTKLSLLKKLMGYYKLAKPKPFPSFFSWAKKKIKDLRTYNNYRFSCYHCYGAGEKDSGYGYNTTCWVCDGLGELSKKAFIEYYNEEANNHKKYQEEFDKRISSYRALVKSLTEQEIMDLISIMR